MRLWPKEWRILILFHGEDDLERFRHELPAAVYLLPWLSPAEQGDPPAIESDELKSTHQARLQQLGLLAEIAAE